MAPWWKSCCEAWKVELDMFGEGRMDGRGSSHQWTQWLELLHLGFSWNNCMLNGIVLSYYHMIKIPENSCCPNRTAPTFFGIICGTGVGGLKQGTICDLNGWASPRVLLYQVGSFLDVTGPKTLTAVVKCQGNSVAISGLHSGWVRLILNSHFLRFLWHRRGGNAKNVDLFQGGRVGDRAMKLKCWFYLVVNPEGFRIKSYTLLTYCTKNDFWVCTLRCR